MNTCYIANLLSNPKIFELANKVTNSCTTLFSSCHNATKSSSFIIVKDKSKLKKEIDGYDITRSTFNRNESDNNLTEEEKAIDSYCFCQENLNYYSYYHNYNQQNELMTYQNYETYKDLKMMVKQTNPNVSKEEIYEQLLSPFRHEKMKHWDRIQHRFKITYICRYEGCDKEFTKTWNLLDHVRMHEGIKPFVCELCGKTFTQKGNLKKHNIVQHSTESLEERKKFRCEICEKGYTERYNLVVI